MVPMKLRSQTVGAAEQELGVLDAQAAQQHGQAVTTQAGYLTPVLQIM